MPQIALFPLSTVLFPGGLLPLRIFETRYVDMIGRCLRSGEAFGVVLARRGSDTDPEVETATVGTGARIVDFQTLEDGLLGILCHGERRFRIRSRSRRVDGLNCAGIDWLGDRPTPVPVRYQPLVPVLRRALSKLKTIGRYGASDYEDACWIAYRIAELLPLDRELQQRVLETEEPLERLALLEPLLDLSE